MDEFDLDQVESLRAPSPPPKRSRQDSDLFDDPFGLFDSETGAAQELSAEEAAEHGVDDTCLDCDDALPVRFRSACRDVSEASTRTTSALSGQSARAEEFDGTPDEPTHRIAEYVARKDQSDNIREAAMETVREDRCVQRQRAVAMSEPQAPQRLRGNGESEFQHDLVAQLVPVSTLVAESVELAVAAEQTFALSDKQREEKDGEVNRWISEGAAAQLALAKAEAESTKWRTEFDRLRSCLASAAPGGEDFIAGAIRAGPLLARPDEDDVDKLRAELTRGFGELALAKHEGRDPDKKHASPLMKAFLGILLHFTGPRGLSFVTRILPGVDADTVVRWRQAAPKYAMGRSERAIALNWDNCVGPAIKEMGLELASWVLGEDGSSGQKALVIQVEKVGDTNKAVLYGLDGDPIVVVSVAEVAAAIRERGLATTLYVMMLIPLVHGAPAIPIVVDANANKFTQADVLETTKTILRVAAKRGYAGRIRRGVSDGDPKLRAVQLRLMFHEGSPAERYVEIPHAFIQLKVPFITGACVVVAPSFARCDHGFALQATVFLHSLATGCTSSFAIVSCS